MKITLIFSQVFICYCKELIDKKMFVFFPSCPLSYICFHGAATSSGVFPRRLAVNRAHLDIPAKRAPCRCSLSVILRLIIFSSDSIRSFHPSTERSIVPDRYLSVNHLTRISSPIFPDIHPLTPSLSSRGPLFRPNL